MFNMLNSAALCPSKGDAVRILGINPWGLQESREAAATKLKEENIFF